MPKSEIFSSTVDKILSVARVGERLTYSGAIVLERIARGGGATKWYCCPCQKGLSNLQTHFSPGSLVSFYFDNQIRLNHLSESKDQITKMLFDVGEVLIGIINQNRAEIAMEIISGPNELSEFFCGIAPETLVAFGVFPMPETDGLTSITVTLPDIDGIVRNHPH